MDFSIFLGTWDRYRAEEVLKATVLPKPCFVCDEEMAIVRLAKKVLWVSFSILCFPVGIYQLMHQATRSLLMSASWKHRTDVIRFAEYWPLDTLTMSQFVFSVFALKILALFRPQTWVGDKLLARDRSLDRHFESSRFVIEAGNATLDALFVRQRGIESLDRVLLYCCSEDELAEGLAYHVELLTLARKIHAHIVVWNYPGIGSSMGLSSRSSMVDAYRKMFYVVEKKMGAKQIVTYGHSLGAAVAMEGLSGYQLAPTTQHLMLARSTISSFAAGMGAEYGRLAGWFVKATGWNFNNLSTISKIAGKCLVVQTAAVKDCQELERPSQVMPDGSWDEPESTLGHALLQKPVAKEEERSWKVLGVREGYGVMLGSKSIHLLASEINNYFHRSWLPRFIFQWFNTNRLGFS